jgi:hypothetical protein
MTRWRRPGIGRPLSRRERWLAACLLVMAAAHGGGALLDSLVLGPRARLRGAVAAAEQQARRQRDLLARADAIGARYRALDAAVAGDRDPLRTENDVLRELSALAGDGVRVKSVVPRLGHDAGRPVMLVALDCEGPFAAVHAYLDRILAGVPGEIGNLTLAQQPGIRSGVVCRLSLRVGGLDDTTGR